MVRSSRQKGSDPATEAEARSREKENDWGVQSVLPAGNSSVTVEMWTDRGRGVCMGEGEEDGQCGCGGVETGHLGWHHLIVWDNKHMVIGSECRPAIIVRQKILQFHSSQYL